MEGYFILAKSAGIGEHAGKWGEQVREIPLLLAWPPSFGTFFYPNRTLVSWSSNVSRCFRLLFSASLVGQVVMQHYFGQLDHGCQLCFQEHTPRPADALSFCGLPSSPFLLGTQKQWLRPSTYLENRKASVTGSPRPLHPSVSPISVTDSMR